MPNVNRDNQHVRFGCAVRIPEIREEKVKRKREVVVVSGR